MFQHPWSERVGLLLSVAAFSLIVGWTWSTRYWAFQTAAWDLGVYHQAFYTTVFDHRWFYYTADLPAGTNGALFAAHFSPFLVLLVPIYALAANPSTLLGIQAAGLALGAIPLFYLARARLGPGFWPALFAGIYLLTPLTVGTGWYDFHPEAFLPATGLTAVYFYDRRRIRPFLLALALTLSVIETIAPFLLLFAAVGLLAALYRKRALGPQRFRQEIVFSGSAALLCAISLAISVTVTYAVSANGGTFGSGYGQYWSILGARSIFDVYPRAILAPSSAVAALGFDPGLKALYATVVFGSLAFVPLFGQRRYLMPVLAWLGLALLSNHVGYFLMNDQYTGYLIPFLFPAAIGGIEWWRRVDLRTVRMGRRNPAIGAALIVALIATTAVCSPFLPTPIGSFNAVQHGFPKVNPDDQLLHQVLGLVPANAGILTTSLIFPEVSNRANAYVVPISSLFVRPLDFAGVVGNYVNESRFVLVDYKIDFTGAVILAQTANLSGFRLEAAADGAYLYERGWQGPPALWIPFSESVAGGDLRSDPHVAIPSGPGPFGPTLRHQSNQGTGLFWSGPAIEAIPPGSYEVRATVEMNASVPGPQSAFAVLDAPINLSETDTPVGSNAHAYTFRFSVVGVPPTVLVNQTSTWNGSGPPDVLEDWSAHVAWTGPGYLETEGWVLSAPSTQVLFSVSIDQLTAT